MRVFFLTESQMPRWMLTSLSSCRRSILTLEGQAPAWWWWNCLEPFFPLSQQHEKQMREQQRGLDKQNNRLRTFPLRVRFSFLFFSPLTRLCRFFRGKHRQSLARTPLFLSLVDKSAHWVRLEGLERAAHSLHSHPIRNFHKLGQGVANPCQDVAVLLCYASFRKVSVNVLKSYILRKLKPSFVLVYTYTQTFLISAISHSIFLASDDSL